MPRLASVAFAAALLPSLYTAFPAHAQTAATPVPSDTFAEQVATHFASWDRDHDGTLTVAEIDAAVADPAISGSEAAAIAALKRAVRTKTYHLPPLTSENLRTLAARAPGSDHPDLAAFYKASLGRIHRAYHSLFAPGSPSLSSIRQGKLGDCFCLAPLGALLYRSPEQVTALFQPQEDHTYKVVLGKETVRVAPPTDAEIALTAAAEPSGFWVNLYEKAVGTSRTQKVNPAVAATASPIDAVGKGGSAGTMLAMLTGHDIERLSCRFAKDAQTTPEQREAKLNEMREKLQSAFAEKRLVTTGTERPTTPGVTPNHAYAVLGYDAATDSLRLWNPHGDGFTPKGTPGLQYGYARTNGVFTIPLTDFVQQFAGLAFELVPATRL